jgi:hypothetical protein
MEDCYIMLSILVFLTAIEAGFVLFLLGLWLSHHCPR